MLQNMKTKKTKKKVCIFEYHAIKLLKCKVLEINKLQITFCKISEEGTNVCTEFKDKVRY